MIKPKIRLSTLLLVMLAVGVGVVLFRVSERVQTAEDNLARMEQAAAKEAENVRVLRAEWDYLNRPDRLESLAHKYLKMEQAPVSSVWADGNELPPASLPEEEISAGVKAQDIVLQAPVSPEQSAHNPAPAAPPVPHIKPRHDTEDFRTMLNKLAPAAGGAE